MTNHRILAIDQWRSTVATLEDEREWEAAVATFFADYALPVVEGNLCTFATRAVADSLYLRHRINPWPNDLQLNPIPGTDVWYLTIESRRGCAGGVSVRDPPGRSALAVQRS